MIRRCLSFFLLIPFLASGQIHVSDTLVIGGIRQYIEIKGKDDTRPILLFLHGGPGGSVMAYADKFTRRLQEHFIVVQWDQRETGNTLRLNASPVPLTLALFENDTYELIRALLTRFNRPKLYLTGHSWGTALGFSVAERHPELLYAFLAVSPMIDQVQSEKMLLSVLLENARQKNDQRQLEELEKIKIPFETSDDLYYQRKGLFDYNGQSNKTFTRDFAKNWCDTWLPVWNEAMKTNRFITLPEVKCPLYLFTGRDDLQTHYALTEKYYNQLKAPRKNLFWFENTKHSVPTSKPEELQSIIIEQILPETLGNPSIGARE